MNENELATLKNKIKVLKIFNFIFWGINLLLIILPLWHYYLLDFVFEFDYYFAFITLLNIFGFYISYEISNKLIYFKRKYFHFSDRLSSKK
jgi:hypothetical protein